MAELVWPTHKAKAQKRARNKLKLAKRAKRDKWSE